MYIGILQRGDRTDGQVSKMKVVAAADKGAPLLPFGAAISNSEETRTTRIIVVMAAVDMAPFRAEVGPWILV